MDTATAPKEAVSQETQSHQLHIARGMWEIEREQIWVLHRALVECGAGSSAQETLRNLGQKPADGLFTDDERDQLKNKYFKMLIAL